MKKGKRIIALLAGGGVLFCGAKIISGTDLTQLISENRINSETVKSVPLYVGLLLSFALLIISLKDRNRKPGNGKTVRAGSSLGKGRPGVRELALVAGMTAFAIAGRAAFFAIPGFTPIFGIVILSGAALGARNGFFVGALSMLLSNFLFGQGPWTPWQMAAMGLLGVLGHLFFKDCSLPKARTYVSALSALITAAVYGGIMNFAAAAIARALQSPEQVLAYYVAGLPVDLVHGAASFVFMWFLAEPLLSELNRVIQKYRL